MFYALIAFEGDLSCGGPVFGRVAADLGTGYLGYIFLTCCLLGDFQSIVDFNTGVAYSR